MRSIWLIRFYKLHTIFRRWFVSTKNKLFAFSRSEIHNLECKPDQYKWLHLLWQYNNDFKNFLISFSINYVITWKRYVLDRKYKEALKLYPTKMESLNGKTNWIKKYTRHWNVKMKCLAVISCFSLTTKIERLRLESNVVWLVFRYSKNYRDTKLFHLKF